MSETTRDVEAEMEEWRERALTAEGWDVRNFHQEVIDYGAIQHEDGWVMMTKEHAEAMRSKVAALSASYDSATTQIVRLTHRLDESRAELERRDAALREAERFFDEVEGIRAWMHRNDYHLLHPGGKVYARLESAIQGHAARALATGGANE